LNTRSRYAIRIGAGILLLLVLLWVVAFVVISLKADTISEMARAQINKQVKGTVEIGDLSPNFFRTFPNVSVRLADVSIRDSLWNEHHHDFLSAEKIYISLKLWSLVTGKPRIGNIIIENASIHLYTDECGNCNLNPTERVGFSTGSERFELPEFTFHDTRLIIENEFLNSYHDFEATYLDCEITEQDSVYDMHIDMNAIVHSLGFNMAKGSYLEGKSLDGDFHVSYVPKHKISFDSITLDIDQHPFTVTGEFMLHTEPLYYELDLRTKNVNYKKASGLLTESLRQKIDSVNIVQPFNIAAQIKGVMAYKAVPGITVQFDVKEVDMTTTMGPLAQCTFNGVFINQVDTLTVPGDPNSKFTFSDVSASYSGIPLRSALIEIENLLNPSLKTHLQSNFALKDLNDLTESSTIRFLKGSGSLDLHYHGSIGNLDTVYPDISGSFNLTDADFLYIPRNLLFQHGNGNLAFIDEDVIINNLSATAGNTELMMRGRLINLLALLNNDLAQPLMELQVTTPDLSLDDFLSYIKPRQSIDVVKKTRKNKLIKSVETIDRFLHDGTAQLHIDAGKVSYKKFVATDVAASIKLIENKVLIDDVALQHAGGKILLKGSLINGNQSNQLALTSTITNVNIPGLFQAFDNFGQDAISSQNIRGKMTATVHMTGVITDKAMVAENSMRGSVDFSIRQGELINFEPAMKIAATALKKRDFSQIQFGELTSRLTVNGSAIEMDKMEIRSNVVVLFAEGIYDTKKGTDMSIQVPLSNLSKAENDINNTGRVGANIRLRAKTGDDGKLAVTWDPFNNAARERKAEGEAKADEKAKAKAEADSGKEKAGRD
jgi:hypothetical protein